MDTLSNNRKSDETSVKVPSFDNFPTVFKGARFNVHSFKATGKSGKSIQKDVITHPGAVLILPLLDPEHIVMIRNKRFAVDQELWELPAGTLEPGEAPIETAKRELTEETGYRAEKIIPFTTFFTTPGICNEVMYAFAATDLTFVGQALEETEQITVEIVSWQNALRMTHDGTILDGKTLTAILFYQVFYAEKCL